MGGRTGATRTEKVPWASEEEVSCLHPWLPPPAAGLQDPGPSVSTGRPSRTRDSAAEPRECRYLAALLLLPALGFVAASPRPLLSNEKQHRSCCEGVPPTRTLPEKWK